MGEAKRKELACQKSTVALDTFGGRIHVEWNPSAAVTPLGQLPFQGNRMNVRPSREVEHGSDWRWRQ